MENSIRAEKKLGGFRSTSDPGEAMEINLRLNKWPHCTGYSILQQLVTKRGIIRYIVSDEIAGGGKV
jgi:hypothetical protein